MTVGGRRVEPFWLKQPIWLKGVWDKVPLAQRGALFLFVCVFLQWSHVGCHVGEHGNSDDLSHKSVVEGVAREASTSREVATTVRCTATSADEAGSATSPTAGPRFGVSTQTSKCPWPAIGPQSWKPPSQPWEKTTKRRQSAGGFEEGSPANTSAPCGCAREIANSSWARKNAAKTQDEVAQAQNVLTDAQQIHDQNRG